ncbi:DNA adenine methylase [Undibacterium rugosum]|uniref:DNA adenine methylase n=1 Tax=Undibacterium rugosum TaxID=2762291 RepID=UPI001B81001E|nr:DNA adenine methylase [Undibacterium rugosum]MBR7777369.1 DNA adenine methylase [Undibacterium rugosum]
MSKPIIPWIGGKRRLAKHIIPLFPEHQCYVEPFSGAAAIYFLKTPAKAEVLNDINGELMNLYRVIKYHLDALIDEFRWTLVGRRQFDWYKSQPTEQLTDIQRAARFYYLQKTAFGGKVDGQAFGTQTDRGPRFNLLRLQEDFSEAHLRLSDTVIENLPWADCIKRYDRPHTLFYCDPPYWGTEGYGVDFGLEQYALMADLARTIKGKMVISVNDIPEMREIFAGLNMDIVDINYTIGGAKNSKNKTRELIIRSW